MSSHSPWILSRSLYLQSWATLPIWYQWRLRHSSCLPWQSSSFHCIRPVKKQIISQMWSKSTDSENETDTKECAPPCLSSKSKRKISQKSKIFEIKWSSPSRGILIQIWHPLHSSLCHCHISACEDLLVNWLTAIFDLLTLIKSLYLIITEMGSPQQTK